jgi:hypothetical protein
MDPFIKRISLVLLLAVCLYSSAAYLIENIKAWDASLITDDGASVWDARLSELRADLPTDVQVVGYVSDWDVLPDYNYPDNETEYVLTQYAMAPVIVARGGDREWIIVNLAPRDFKTWLAAQPSDVDVTKYPNGLYLVQRR